MPEPEGWSTSGEPDDRPTEEVAAVVELNAPPTEELLATLEGESKDDPHADEMMDFKPIPAEELDEGETEHVDHWSSEVALDRKGDDRPVEAETGDEVALDRKGDDGPAMDGKQGDLTPDHKVLDSDLGAEDGKIVGSSFKEYIHLKIDASEPAFKVEIDTVEPDHKFLKGEIEGAFGIPTDSKDPAYIGGKFEGLENLTGYENLEPVLGRAVTDSAFRERLAQDPSAALGEYDLSDEELGLLGQISPKQLEQMAGEVQARFSESTDVSIQAAQGTMLAELLWGTDLKDKLDSPDATSHGALKGE